MLKSFRACANSAQFEVHSLSCRHSRQVRVNALRLMLGVAQRPPLGHLADLFL